MSNILVTGADGQLGRALRLVARNGKATYFFTDAAELDITDPAAVEKTMADLEPAIVVNCAAYTDVEKAEEEVERAERLNTAAVADLAAVCAKYDALLIHISTDYVFGGNSGNTPRDESEPTNPTGVYGRTKLAGERTIAASGCRYLILRTSWLYSPFGKNFLRTMLRLTAERETLDVVFDQIGTPTYAGDLAQAIFDIIENRKYEGRTGIYHYSDEGVCSWYDFAVEIAAAAGHTECRIRPCHSCEFPAKAVRPAYSVLDKTKFKTTFGMPIPHWRESMLRCLKEMQP